MAEEKGKRVILRMTDSQFELMKNLGGALGIELDSQCAKHFFLLGMQSSMSSLTTRQNADLIAVMQAMKAVVMEESGDHQLDLVEEAQAAKKKSAPRARARA